MNFVRCSVTLTIYFKFSYIAFFYKPIVQLNIHEILHINCFYYIILYNNLYINMLTCFFFYLTYNNLEIKVRFVNVNKTYLGTHNKK